MFQSQCRRTVRPQALRAARRCHPPRGYEPDSRQGHHDTEAVVDKVRAAYWTCLEQPPAIDPSGKGPEPAREPSELPHDPTLVMRERLELVVTIAKSYQVVP